MLSPIIFEAIPKAYPIKIKHKKNILFPLAVLAFHDFIIDIGQEIPKLITMMVSNKSFMVTPLRQESPLDPMASRRLEFSSIDPIAQLIDVFYG